MTIKKEETKEGGSRYCLEDNREHAFLVKEVTFPQLSYVGTSKVGGFLKTVTHGKGEKDKGPLSATMGQIKRTDKLGQIKKTYQLGLLDPIAIFQYKGSNLEDHLVDIIKLKYWPIQTKTIAPLEAELQVNQEEERETDGKWRRNKHNSSGSKTFENSNAK